MRANAAERARSAYRAGLTLLIAAACYEAVARSGVFPAALLPTLPKVASTLLTSTLDGTLPEHAAYTMYRVLFGLALTIVSSEHRSQLQNRAAARARLANLVTDALAPPPPARRPTRPSRAARQRRLDAKRHRGELKANRGRPRLD